MKRLQGYLTRLGHWDDKQQEELEAEMKQHVTDTWKEACSYGTMTDGPFLDPREMFEDVYKDTPPHLRKQRQESGV